ncbi:hypothetical protein ANN_27925 [Periplaneta americana]|uniref:Uncharacterized protein n=1 Tax=Periplaneta americana TaxID=6978 RepID=A0ABQ8RVI4_PERAM|nr:hypothetical protein ANN_27925 [Periplaneta americana]
MNLATVLSFDFMQHLPVPHLQSNILYYSRQLWLYIFGVHNLADDHVTLFTYHEGVAEKGQCEVTSMLFRHLEEENGLKQELISVSAGQNKNFVMVYFRYILVHCFGMFKRITSSLSNAWAFLPAQRSGFFDHSKEETKGLCGNT